LILRPSRPRSDLLPIIRQAAISLLAKRRSAACSRSLVRRVLESDHPDGLRRAMAKVGSFPLQILKDAAQKCALEVGQPRTKGASAADESMNK
jgi:hypothetical protein